MANPPRDRSITSFPTTLSIDTCTVWNVLCSNEVVAAAKSQQRVFVLADFVRYECLVKQRKSVTAAQTVAQKILSNELKANKYFCGQTLEVGDLIALVTAVGSAKRFHKGEFAALALAHKYHCGFMTDDTGARRVGENVLGEMVVRTMPHLVGWLVYVQQLSDGDIPKIIDAHDEIEDGRGHLGEFIQACYEHAMMLRLKDKGAP